MNKVITALKRIRLGQILMVFLAGVLLFVGTACSNGGGTTAGVQTGSRQDTPAGKLAVPGKNNPRPEVPEEAETSRFQGSSMNEFSDVDPRAKGVEARAADKAAALKENSERNLEKRADSVEKYVENYQQGTPLGERVKRLGEDVGSSVDDLKEGVSKETQRGLENTQDATRNLTKSFNRAAEDTKQTVKANAPDARELTRGVSRAAEDATENTKAAGTNLVDRAQQAIENTGEFVQGKLNQATQGTQNTVDNAARNTLNKTGNAINDAIDIH